MKKYLMMALAALTIVSCSKSDDVYNPNAEHEATAKVYAENFAKVFGTPKSTQTWGFGTSSANAITRSADPRGNMWASEGYTIPSAITAAELAKVKAVFAQKGEERYTALVDWSTFFVQQVYKGDSVYIAKNNGSVTGANHMDWLCAFDPTGFSATSYAGNPAIITGHDDHVNDFNNGFSNDYNGCMLMVNSSTRQFGFKSSIDNGHVFYNFRMEEIDGNYYVGLDFEAAGQNSNEQVDRDFVYDDWIVKIVPGKGTSRKVVDEGLIVCEDLGTTDDFDFNDVVFYAKLWSDGQADITLLAAGGTLNLTVAGEEVHQKFGVSQKTMVNTGASGGVTKDPVNFTAAQTYSRLIDIPIVVSTKNSAGEVTSYALTAEMGKAPQKIRLPKYFKWCGERKSLAEAYPGFKDWTTGAADSWASSTQAYSPAMVFEGSTNY